MHSTQKSGSRILQGQNNPKTHNVMEVVGNVPVAERTPREPFIKVPGAPADYASSLSLWRVAPILF